MTYFLDSNVIIDLLNGNKKVLQNFKAVFQTDQILIPDIVYYELLRGFYWKDPKNQLTNFEIFAKTCGIRFLDLETLKIAAENYAYLMKTGNKLDDDDDILIGSLAVRHNAILVTNNINHLSRIKDIKLVNWRD